MWLRLRVSLSLSLCLFLCLSVSLFLCLSLFLSLSLSLPLSLAVLLSLSLSPISVPSVCLWVCLSVCLATYLRASNYSKLSLFFQSICLTVCLPRKSDAKSDEVLRLSCKIILANLTIWCSKMQPFSGNLIPDLLHLWWRCLLYRACHAKCIFADPLQPSQACHVFWNTLRGKNGWMSKSGPTLLSFQRDFDMCFVPLTGAVCLCATAACTFWYFFNSSTSRSASCSGPQSFYNFHF